MMMNSFGSRESKSSSLVEDLPVCLVVGTYMVGIKDEWKTGKMGLELCVPISILEFVLEALDQFQQLGFYFVM